MMEVKCNPANIASIEFDGERTQGFQCDIVLTTKDGYKVTITEDLVAIIADGMELEAERQGI